MTPPKSKKIVKNPGTDFNSATDFYTNEQGFIVFTEAHHRKRGYCCKNGCLHCPYGFKKL